MTEETEAPEPEPKATGIYQNLPEDEYHGDRFTISKSGLWKLHSQTPAHFKYAAPRENEPALDFGKATHLMILEPDLAEKGVTRGPVDRRGSKWKDARAEAQAANNILLTEGDYDGALIIRDAAAKHPVIKKLRDAETMYEASGFWTDNRTGLGLRCRPDIYVPGITLMADLKTTADAAPWGWARTAGTLGYHMQEAMYTEGWQEAGGGDVSGFIFICIEKKQPYCTIIYELDPSASAEGHAVMQKALDKYKVCLDADEWPGYPTQVQPLDIPVFSYRETDAPNRGAN